MFVRFLWLGNNSHRLIFRVSTKKSVHIFEMLLCERLCQWWDTSNKCAYHTISLPIAKTLLNLCVTTVKYTRETGIIRMKFRFHSSYLFSSFSFSPPLFVPHIIHTHIRIENGCCLKIRPPSYIIVICLSI